MTAARFEPPLTPDGEEARRWVQEELAKPVYTAAEPTPFDRFMQWLRDWFFGLFSGEGAPPGIVLLVALVVVAALVVAAWIVFGRPRASQRRRATTPLFSDDDVRDAASLRRAAERAAAEGDWELATLERFRALVRDLVERELVEVHPGTTAHAVGERAAAVLPAEREALQRAAARFDDARYLGRGAGRDDYESVTRLEAVTRSATPVGAGA